MWKNSGDCIATFSPWDEVMTPDDRAQKRLSTVATGVKRKSVTSIPGFWRRRPLLV